MQRVIPIGAAMAVRVLLTVVVIPLILLRATPARAQNPDTFKSVGGVLQDAARLAGQKAAFNAQIEAARAAFFRAYETGENLEGARQAFAHSLLEKDYYFMTLMLADGPYDPHGEKVDRLTGGLLDGGIRPAARRGFNEWVIKIREGLGARQPRELLFPFLNANMSPENVIRSIETAESEYHVYQAARDSAEFEARGLHARRIADIRPVAGTPGAEPVPRAGDHGDRERRLEAVEERRAPAVQPLAPTAVAPERLVVQVGTVLTPMARRGPDGARPAERITWSSSDSGVVSITSDGHWKAMVPGRSMLSATGDRAVARIEVTVESGCPVARREGCLLTAHSAPLEPYLRSVESSAATTIQFVNSSGVPIQVHWLDFGGKRVLYATLTAHQAYQQQTFTTHPWLISDTGGRALGIYVNPSTSPGQVVVSP